jgi:hypothetical protein
LTLGLLAVGIFLAGMAANRLLTPPSANQEPSSTAPAHTEAAPARQNSESTSDGESTSDDDHSEAGAVRAALDLAAAPQAWLYLTDAAIETAVRHVATFDDSDRLVGDIVGDVAVVRDALTRSAGPVWWVVRPLASRVDAYTPDRAQVSVWTVTVLSAADVAMPQSDWFVTSLDLRWESGGWRLAATSESRGPTPQLGGRDEAWEPEPFDDALAGFQRVGSEVAP